MYEYEHPMSDPRYRYSGRRSPTFNPARASMPVYGSLYDNNLHAVPTARYDTSATRRHDHHSHRTPTTTITTYNVTKEPISRSSSVRDHSSHGRHRASTINEAPLIKPIIVTTNHARPLDAASSSHTSGSSRRTHSPTKDNYRTSEEPYYAQPASSIRSRSHQRHHSASYDNEEITRLRERVGGENYLRAPHRPSSRQAMYQNPPRAGGTDFVEDYEYTKPSDLARYDLDHDGPRSRSSRRDSMDRGSHYVRPTVSVVSNDLGGRADGRRAPPTSGALDRYNRNLATSGIYDRPTVTMPALPPAAPAPPPPIDPARRSGTLDVPSSPTTERRGSGRPRPVSLYQDAPPRMSQADELYRPRDDERLYRDRRERERGDDVFRDDTVTSRGFGLRPELLEQADGRRTADAGRREPEERRPRREQSREPKRKSDEELEKTRGRHHERRPSEVKDRPVRVDESRDRRDNTTDKVRDKVVAGLGVAAAAIGLGAAKEKEKDKEAEKENKGSPKRRTESDPDSEPLGSRAADRYKPREAETERKASPREDPIIVEQRREAQKDRTGARDPSVSRERDREREKEKERERDVERERERSRRTADVHPSTTKGDRGDSSPSDNDSAKGTSRRRRRPSIAFNPNDTKGLADLKAQLAAMDEPEKPKEKVGTVRKDRLDTEYGPSTVGSSASEKLQASDRDRDRLRDKSRSREAVANPEQKQVRVVSPPRDKGDDRPKGPKGILKQPTSQFPEDKNPIREGVAPHKDDKTKADVPNGARWTKVNRRIINPEALTIGKERFEVRDDFVIVLRVLSKEEIQGYATATAQLREMRRKEFEKDNGDRDSDRGRDRDDEDRRRRRHRRDEEDDDRKDRDRDGDRDRHRRHKHEDHDEDRPLAIEYDDGSSRHSHGHQRSHRDRDSETIASSTDDRR